jgi:phosphatidylserine decarboxylase
VLIYEDYSEIMWQDRLFAQFQYLLPQRLLSRLVRGFANCRIGILKNFLIKNFVNFYKVDMSQAQQPDPLAYENFNAFFTRTLRPDARPIVSEAFTIASPVDGCVSQLGNIKNDRIFQAKGFDFSLYELLGGSEQRVAPFIDGQFATIYLAPRDYHRIHMPLTSTLHEMVYIPGQLFSVNGATAQNIPRLFSRNERVACIFHTEYGPMAMVLVGAMIVASIHTAWAGEITPGSKREVQTWQYPTSGQEAKTLQRGMDMGHFQLGSTVVLLFPPDMMNWVSHLQAGSIVQMGQHIGSLSHHL